MPPSKMPARCRRCGATRRIGCATINTNNDLIAAIGANVPAHILDGIAIRDQIYGELKQDIATLGAAGIRPGLAAVLGGGDPPSQIYVGSKIAGCRPPGLGRLPVTPAAPRTPSEN